MDDNNGRRQSYALISQHHMSNFSIRPLGLRPQWDYGMRFFSLCFVVDGFISNVVQHVQVPVISKHMCNFLYQKISSKIRIHISNDMLCAGLQQGGKDACQVRQRTRRQTDSQSSKRIPVDLLLQYRAID